LTKQERQEGARAFIKLSGGEMTGSCPKKRRKESQKLHLGRKRTELQLLCRDFSDGARLNRATASIRSARLERYL